MIAGDFIEDYETMVPFQTPQAVGHGAQPLAAVGFLEGRKCSAYPIWHGLKESGTTAPDPEHTRPLIEALAVNIRVGPRSLHPKRSASAAGIHGYLK